MVLCIQACLIALTSHWLVTFDFVLLC
jgi:hypothetical protein